MSANIETDMQDLLSGLDRLIDDWEQPTAREVAVKVRHLARIVEKLIEINAAEENESSCDHPQQWRERRPDGSESCRNCLMELFGPYQTVDEKSERPDISNNAERDRI
jgi:hypothetical protein